MLITAILISHLALVASVVAGFGFRYYSAFKNKNYPESGQGLLLGGSILLVISGVLLSVLSKVGITKLCLESLGLIVALFIMEYGLKKLGQGLSSEHVKSED